MPSRIERAAAGRVLHRRYTEQDDGPHTQLGQPDDLLAKAVAGVLDDVRQGDDRLWLGDVLAHEQRSDEIGRPQGRLGDQLAHRRRAA